MAAGHIRLHVVRILETVVRRSTMVFSVVVSSSSVRHLAPALRFVGNQSLASYGDHRRYGSLAREGQSTDTPYGKNPLVVAVDTIHFIQKRSYENT